jgi:hypothetical protein
MIIREIRWEYGLDLSGSGQRPVVGTVNPVMNKCWGYVEQLSGF